MKNAGFHYCMLIGATALAGVALYYLLGYFFTLSVALDNNNLEAALDHSIRAQWLAFACQSLLIALLYVLVAFKPHSVTREVIVLLGLLQLVECVLLFTFSGSTVAAGLLIAASLFVLAGAMLWPKPLPEPQGTAPVKPV
ncbi:MAG TPA: hypothetical protein VKO83_08450 [Steroidobacteraceae bacterium]|nr:hypothetical protein [Steroidobacteraceae bacterium]